MATIRLRRPAQRNSLHGVDLHTLLSLFSQIDADRSVRVVVLSAATEGQPRPVFSAGYSVAGFDNGEHDPMLFERVAEALAQLRPITVCALRGSVYGGATDLALASTCASALQAPNGACPPRRWACTIARADCEATCHAGFGLAQRAFLTAQALTIEELATVGLFQRVVDAEGFDAALAELADNVAKLAPLAAQVTKQSLNEIAAGCCDEQSLRERELRTTRSADFAEWRAAFAQRRGPRFIGE